MPVYLWSQVSNSNASVDSTINWAEGQSPSSINDSARAMMAALAKYRDDISGSIVTTGTSTAYIVASNSGYDELAHLDGQLIAFTPHTTNAAGSPSVTLNVDSLGAKPIRTAPSVDIQSGVLIQGTPYAAIYNNTDGAYYLFGVGAAPGVPLGAGMDYWGSTTPASAFAFPAGQAISRTTYATLFSLVGTTYGTGDGSTTFNLPDKRGRVTASSDSMGGSAAGRLTSVGAALGDAGGEQSHALVAGETPTITSSVSVNGPTSGEVVTATGTNNFAIPGGSGTTLPTGNSLTNSLNFTGSATSNNTGGSNPSHNNVQPTIVCNYIMRII
jgi:microcystin-dependent protein